MDICSVNTLVRFNLSRTSMLFKVIGSKRSNEDGSIRSKDRLQSDTRRLPSIRRRPPASSSAGDRANLWRLARSLLDNHAPERRIGVDPAWKSTRCIDVINISDKLKLNKASDLPMPQIAMDSSTGLSCPSVVIAVGDILEVSQETESFPSRLVVLSRFKEYEST